MASPGWLHRVWHREGVTPAVRALGLILLAGSLSAFLAAASPANGDTPVMLFRLIGISALVAAVLIWCLGPRPPHWLLHATIVSGILAITLVIAKAATAVGMVVSATDYMWMAVYTAFFFSRAAARAYLASIAVLFGAALLINSHGVPLDAWIVMTASVIVVSETVGRQSTRLRHEAHTDELTGLLNRKGLAIAAERAFSLADRTGISLTIALLDLDDFKLVNDEEGHAAGDKLLMRLAEAWEDGIQPGDIFARLGGDEFLAVIVGYSDAEAARLFQRMRFSSPAPWSAGVIKRGKGQDLSTCLAQADNALYQAKRERTSSSGDMLRARSMGKSRFEATEA